MTDAKEYGKALFELAEESGRTEKILEELKTLQQSFAKNPKYVALLDTPALPKEEKLGLVDKAFSGVDEYLLNFVKILCESRAIYLFDGACQSFFAMYDEARGIVRAEVITAVPMTEGQCDAMKNKLETITGKSVVVTNKVDREILGGVVLRYSGVQFDGSIKSRLDEFKKNLSNIVM